ncbi:NACHT domain-containing protein [Longispora sp. NPDC051575]|uniref:NACHT domain-containing protein n=1 Tax=Longispora sp. NPDC051575 TaxID=3154943 RepID=UPI003442B857
MSVVLTTLLGYVGAMVTQVTGDVVHARASGRSRRRLAARAADAAQTVMLPAGSADLAERLSADQRRTLADYLHGPVFAQMVRQALVYSARPASDEAGTALRDQIRYSLRHTGVFGDDICFEVTDLVVHLVQVAVHDPDGAVPELDGHTLAIGADVAAAGVRNADLLLRIDSLVEIDGFALSLREAARAQHTRLRLQHTGESRFVDYSRLYVAPHLRLLEDPEEDPSTAAEVMADRFRTVVTGDPGAGKSTFAAKLVHDVAADEVPGLEGLVPLLLVVREHTAGLRHGHDTLVSYLEAVCRRPHHLVPPPDALEYLLLNGRALVVIDGLDELGTAEHRRSFARMVEGFVHRYPLTRVVVTSRVVGYYEAPLERGLFPVSSVAPFTKDQIAEYVTKWFALDPDRSSEEGGSLAGDFLRESADARDLCANPLMLSLLCTLYSSTHYIPRNRPEIYERCAELLFVTWDKSRDIEVPHRFSSFVRPAVQRLAWQLFTDPAGRQVLPRAELSRSLAEYLATKRFEDPDEAVQAAEDFLDFCAGRAWVLTDMGVDAIQPQYGFVHRTFLEYFAASQLVKRKPDPAAVWEQLKGHLFESSWSVVSQLAVQILDRAHEGGADELLRLAMVESDADVARSSTVLLFAARTLGTVSPGFRVTRALVERAVLLACSVPLSARISTSQYDNDWCDLPLLEVLKVVNPDNYERITTVVVETVERAVRASEYEYPSAGMVHASFAEQALASASYRIRMGDRFVDRFGADVPRAAARWRRCLERLTQERLHEGGFHSLFDRISTGWLSTESQADWILHGIPVLPPGRRRKEAVDLIVGLYPQVLAGFQPLVAGESSPLLGMDFEAASWRRLDKPPEFRAVLLLIAAADVLLEPACSIHPGEVATILRAHNQPSQRATARRLLADLELPLEADLLFAEWIEGRVPGGGTL